MRSCGVDEISRKHVEPSICIRPYRNSYLFLVSCLVKFFGGKEIRNIGEHAGFKP